MALERFFLPILIAVLLFSQVFARQLGEKPAAGEKDVAVKVHDASLEADKELDASNMDDINEADDFNDDKRYSYEYGYRYRGKGYGYGYRYKYRYGSDPRYGYRHSPYCRYYCERRCCSAEEYAEFVQDLN